ncbi:hypothetical protein [Microbacterium sp.]|uniref:hypothetical protein n=1 Tax=Microbacterium sp. TaxID=51671 RepID=UPI003F9B8321
MTPETVDTTSFIGTTPVDEYQKAQSGHTAVEPYAAAVRIRLSDGTVHKYVGAWERTVREEGRTVQHENGYHFYALSGAGELYVVMAWTVTLYKPGGGRASIMTNKAVAITYAAHAWVSADGPRGIAPEKDEQERIYPPADREGKPE